MVRIYSSYGYADVTKNYGDCIVLIKDNDAIVFDCGSEEHAQRVISLLNEKMIRKATVILSHNDADHFDGIPYLISQGRVSQVFTILLLKYKDELLERLNDQRRNRHSIGEAIKQLYDNIDSLSGKVILKDVYEDADDLPSWITRIGPELDYMLDAVAKALNNSEGDNIDGTTIVNAASVQIKAVLNGQSILLTGDCAAAAIPSTVNFALYRIVQLPHHGNADQAQQIFDRAYPDENITYIVSDNTGSTNGGSDRLQKAGHNIKNTKTDGDITLLASSWSSNYIGRPLG